MSYTPAIPLSGVAGLRFLERTGEAQREAHAQSPEIQRNIAYFKENIGSVQTAEDLVSDRRLLRVVLESYGLGEEIDKRAFIRRILDEGVDDPNALGSRLNNEAYKQMARDLRLEGPIPRTTFTSIQDKIVSNYLDQNFEEAVGEQNNSLRLALDFKRRAPETAERGWFALMGDSPNRAVLETAFNLPSDVASLDIDKQKELFEDRAFKLFGTRDAEEIFSDSAMMDKLISRYLVLDEAKSGSIGANVRGATALTLLSNITSGFGTGATQSLFQSSL